MYTNNNNCQDLYFWIALHQLIGFGAKKARYLLDNGIHPREVFRPDNRLLYDALKLNTQTRECIRNFNWQAVDNDMRWQQTADRQIIALHDERYPPLLREIYSAPIVLYVIGQLEHLHTPQLAIVGSRNPSHHGAETAFEFAKALAGSGFSITSGLALGIDAQAHRGALAAQGITIAVMGCGLDIIYPKRNKELAKLISNNGSLVSEFPPQTQPAADHFPRRNRIISGLSIGTLVVEAARQSGSLITARLAMEQGREVFAIPGALHNPLARGCHALIRQGAKLVENVNDIVDELGGMLAALRQHTNKQTLSPPTENQHSNSAHPVRHTLREELAALLDYIGHEPVNADTLMQRSSLTAEAISSMLMELELCGCIQSFGGMYSRQ